MVCSLCQGLLQCVWWVFICYTASPVLWAKLGQIVPQQSHQLLGFGIQTDPDKERNASLKSDHNTQSRVTFVCVLPEGDDAAGCQLLEGDLVHKL